MLVVVILGMIVYALMAVFGSTQRAFRAGAAQSDVNESGRAVMDLITGDLRTMAPSTGGASFLVTNYTGYYPLPQTLPGTALERTNIVSSVFILGRGVSSGRDTWFATGYAVVIGEGDYALYRFATNRPTALTTPGALLLAFNAFLTNPVPYSHVLDGIIGLKLKAFDANGVEITTNSLTSPMRFADGAVNGRCALFTNSLPRLVEVELTYIDGPTQLRAASLSKPGFLPWQTPLQWAYLQRSSGNANVFRQTVAIQNH